MKITISVDEIKAAVSDFMNLKGFDILPEELNIEYQTEGEFDSRVEVFAGMSVDMSKRVSSKH